MATSKKIEKEIKSASGRSIHLEHKADGISELIFDMPGEKINKLSAEVMTELDKTLDNLKNLSQIKVLFIKSRKPNIFIAGADINEIQGITTAEQADEKVKGGQDILNKLEQLPFPTIAVIDGACMGGGLELALACTYRIASDNPKTQMALPEVNLGIIPGFGGTQRLLRLIGLANGLTHVMTGKSVDGVRALKAHLVDACYPQAFLDDKSLDFAKAILSSGGKKAVLEARKNHGFMNWFMEKTFIGRGMVFQTAAKNLASSGRGFYPAPQMALEVVKNTYGGPLEKGLLLERKGFGKVAPGEVSKNLVQIFFTSEELKKDPGASVKEVAVPVSKAAVLGSGVMGGGIAWLFSKADIPVRMKDLNWKALAKGFESAFGSYAFLLKTRKMDNRQVNLKMHHISAGTDFYGFSSADFVIEAVVEDINVKKKVFEELETKVGKKTIIASNTSSLAIGEMSKALKDPSRFIGMHFFNPVNRMPLVEIIAGPKTSSETIARTVSLTKKLGKTPIVVKDCAGFLVNRILLPYLNEAGLLFQEGVKIEQLDKLLYEFGMPMGPMTLLDEIGIDTGYKVAKILENAYGSRMKVAEILRMAYEEKKWLGKKGGKGFYVHSEKGKYLNPEAGEIFAIYLDRYRIQLKPYGEQEVLDRCLLAMINEAAMCVEEKVVASPKYLDMALIMGTGFPPFRGGILRYADNVGLAGIVEKLNGFAAKHGERFKPAKILVELAKSKKTFYQLSK
jgi:3-hydroxyacyl-CoA dehydrogenase/enoyl-CoA hydratase/3-hydroxybutyryl-CoA epimerase